jgi:hypothetical protein
MAKFLTNRLAVPQDHITKLFAREGDDRSSSDYPSRQNILSRLWSLHQDRRIQHGDVIVVFYAGHGVVYSSGGVLRNSIDVDESDLNGGSHYQRKRINFEELEDVPGGPFIDSIVPADRGLPDTDPSYLGRKVPDICDRELNAIFTTTRHMKGPNILFIADCCHSAGITRNSSNMTWGDRALPPLGRDEMQEMLLRAQWNIDSRIASISSMVCILSIVYCG